MVILRRISAALTLLAALAGGVAQASGPGTPSPWYLDQYGGERQDLDAFFAWRVGIVKPTAPRSMLFMSWRLLHRQPVGQAAGAALAIPCCGDGAMGSYDAANAWQKAREAVPGVAKIETLRTGRPTSDYSETANCFPDAFGLAARTLDARVKLSGAGSPEVRAWVDAQDAVFTACSSATAQLPPALASAPAWLKADRAYQQAALTLYAGRNHEAADQFVAIAKDSASPWRTSGRYLAARAEVRQALLDKTDAAYTRASAAIDRLAAAPAGDLGRGDVQALRNVIAYHAKPDAYLGELQKRLGRADLGPDAAIDFRDLLDLGAAETPPPEALDWIATLKARPTDDASADIRASALAHATAKWREGHQPAWLLAALSLAQPADPASVTLVSDARNVAENDPAWLTARYHALRLTLGKAPPTDTRRELDALLARSDLSASDRNIFTAQRAQVAADLDDFLRFTLRTRICADQNPQQDGDKPVGCVRWLWDADNIQPWSLYDGSDVKGTTGFGEDVRAVIDRAPLATRLQISAASQLPKTLRLDVALTSYGRAVGVQDNRGIDEAARQLVMLLPLMADDFKAVAAAKPGPDKRFAEFLVLAKIPGVRPDLGADYRRPEGRRIADFQDHWVDWVLAPANAAKTDPPALAEYQVTGAGADVGWEDHPGTPDALTDLTCLGECGGGASPLRLPDFVAAGQAQAARERLGFALFAERYDDKPQTYPPGGVSTWDEMLAYCRSHPADRRVPEALYWLVHVGHYGGSHNHSGRRAFQLLHARYPTSDWAKKTPYYND